ncbi:iron-sulfur cluster insertion protein ErpA, partial [Pseudomonadales bacterium]|nr:iron-sulfur cluster insertion protein ErpA [Pseudomonadales bacterium]
MQAEISFSESAAIKVKRLIENDGDDSLKLRVFITGGGCNGFSYGFTFDSE